MSHCIPGKIIKTFTTKKGEEAIIRYPKWEDLYQMLDFINTISLEDTYVTFSGEVVTQEGEMYYLAEMLKGIEMQDNLYLSCFVDNRFAGSCSILRDMLGRRRSYHVGVFGITIAKEFRGEGIGEELSSATIDEAKQAIPGLTLLRLQMYSPNTVAHYLYEKLGFIDYGRLPGGIWYKGDYVDEVVMYKRI
ncbi:MAG: GNAT family N-acetyltransferase [Patescibacteria group bacterium]|nr:GNAT family N-acetyltransferase [Patescibacteria group bacterium]